MTRHESPDIPGSLPERAGILQSGYGFHFSLKIIIRKVLKKLLTKRRPLNIMIKRCAKRHDEDERRRGVAQLG